MKVEGDVGMPVEGEELIVVDGRDVIVVRSARRTRTVSADLIQGTLRLRVPLRLSKKRVEEHSRAFLKRLESRASRQFSSDEQLMRRAGELIAKYLPEAPLPSSVVWSQQQKSRWGSTTSSAGTIRLSARLQSMPLWVQDGVLVHELAHLLEPGHGPEFKKLVHRYPRTQESDAFLQGVSFADRES